MTLVSKSKGNDYNFDLANGRLLLQNCQRRRLHPIRTSSAFLFCACLAASSSFVNGFVIRTTTTTTASTHRITTSPTISSSLKYSYLNKRYISSSIPLFAKRGNNNKKGTTTTTTTVINMPRGVKKENLPSKICVICQRPFTWRKKWERCWEEVTTCSKSCNNKRRLKNKKENQVQTESSASVNDIIGNNFENDIQSENRINDVVSAEGGLASTNDETIFENANSDDLLAALDDERITNSGNESINGEAGEDVALDAKAQRKAAKKAMKAKRRAQRQGNGDPTAGQKECDVCIKSVDLLIRCQIDETLKWNMVCGKCWHDVSGGIPDGDASHPYYKYGGLWKNRRRK